MRITDMTALSGFARSTAESASDFATLVHNLVLDIRDSYRPGVHCMRGPGPKWRAKSIRRVVVATPLTVQAERRQDETRAASREMTSSNQFNAFAAARGEGLHPKLRDLLQRAAASPLFGDLDSAWRHAPGRTKSGFGNGGIAPQRNFVSA
jgi:hypothetical protein